MQALQHFMKCPHNCCDGVTYILTFNDIIIKCSLIIIILLSLIFMPAACAGGPKNNSNDNDNHNERLTMLSRHSTDS